MTERRGTSDTLKTIKKPENAVVVLILLASWFLLIHDLGLSSLWLDEVKSITRAMLPDWQAGKQALIQANHAPLYEWIVLRSWLKLGAGDFLARFPGAILSVLTISLTYMLGIRVFRRRTAGVWASLLLAASALFLGFSRWIRPYALLSLLLTLAIYGLWRAMSTRWRRHWLIYALAGAGALYTHYFAAFTLLALSLFVIFRSAVERDKALLRDWALASILLAILFLPWLTTLQTQYSDGAVEWIEPLDLATVLELPARFMDRGLFVAPLSQAVSMLMWVALALGLISWLRRRSEWPGRWGYPFTLFAAAGTLLIAVLVSIGKPLIVPRYFLGILPAICLLFAFTAVYGRPRLLALGLSITILAAGLFSSSVVATRQTSENWKAVAVHIQEHSRPDDKLILVDESQIWSAPFEFYYQGALAVGFLPGELSDDQDVQTAIADNCPCNRLWLAQSVRRTASESLDYEPDEEYAGYRVVERVLFDEDLIRDRLAVDLWLLEGSEE